MVGKNEYTRKNDSIALVKCKITFVKFIWTIMRDVDLLTVADPSPKLELPTYYLAINSKKTAWKWRKLVSGCASLIRGPVKIYIWFEDFALTLWSLPTTAPVPIPQVRLVGDPPHQPPHPASQVTNPVRPPPRDQGRRRCHPSRMDN